MSLKDRIQKFEALGKEKADDKSETGGNQLGHGKKFYYPGKHSRVSNEPKVVIPQAKTKHNTFQNYEADLQEVWSVRKNIHHTNNSTSVSNNNHGASHNKFSQCYSRHGAIPAQPVGDSQMSGRFSLGRSKRSPLQEQNEVSRTWNLKTPGFSYTECFKRPGGQSPIESDSPPQTKRKLTIREGSPKLVDVPPIRSFFFQSQEQNEKRSQYAQRMVQGHLKSVGMGKYTPEAGYTRHQQDNKTIWKKSDHDEFSFD